MLRPGGVTHSHTRTHSPGSIFWLAALSGILVDLCGNKQMQPAQKNDGGKGQQLNVQRVTDMQRLAPTHTHTTHTHTHRGTGNAIGFGLFENYGHSLESCCSLYY